MLVAQWGYKSYHGYRRVSVVILIMLLYYIVLVRLHKDTVRVKNTTQNKLK